MAEELDEIEQKVRAIIANVVQVDQAAIGRDTTLADLGADSLAALGVLSALEQEFGVDIPDVDAQQLNSLASAAATVRKLVG